MYRELPLTVGIIQRLFSHVSETNWSHVTALITTAFIVCNQEKISRPPDVLDFFTADLQKESPSVNLVAIPSFQLAPQTAELDRAFDLYRHIRMWDNV